MCADILTKATPGRIFRQFRNKILGRIEQIDALPQVNQHKKDSIEFGTTTNSIEGL